MEIREILGKTAGWSPKAAALAIGVKISVETAALAIPAVEAAKHIPDIMPWLAQASLPEQIATGVVAFGALKLLWGSFKFIRHPEQSLEQFFANLRIKSPAQRRASQLLELEIQKTRLRNL